VSPLLWFYYSTAIRKSQEFFRKKFEACERAFFVWGVDPEREPKTRFSASGRIWGQTKKTGGFCLFFPHFFTVFDFV